jgi:hypothetical protein
MKMKRFLVLFLLLSCTAAFSQKKKETSAPTDDWAGTYKLDVARTKGYPAQEETFVLSSGSKDSIKYTISGKDSQGGSYTVTYEGKVGTAAPQMMNGKESAQLTYQWPSSHQVTFQGRWSGGLSGNGTITLAKDNKTFTSRLHLKDAKGAKHDQTMVYVRQ